MTWAFERSAELDKRTCEVCERENGKRFSEPQGPRHARCRCVDLLVWVWQGTVTKAEDIAPAALMRAEQETRRVVLLSLHTPMHNATSVRVALQLGLGEGIHGARVLGRSALANEVARLRPMLDTSPLLRPSRVYRRDVLRGRQAARGLSAWWALAVAALVAKHHYTREHARQRATELLRRKAEGAIITESAEAFSDERRRAAPMLRKLKEQQGT